MTKSRTRPALLPLLHLLCLLLCAASLSAQSISNLLKEADDFYDHGRYREALQYYKQAGNNNTWDKDTKLRAAICFYEINDTESSINLLNSLIDPGKTDELVHFYLARCFQHNMLFEEAIVQYKVYLKLSRNNETLDAWVKDEIMRCASGKRLKYSEQLAFVENLGSSINSLYDEIAPVPSPIYLDRLYFSSARAGSTGGLLDPSMEDDMKYGEYRHDMYFTEQQNGIWKSAEALGDVLNSPANDILMDFSNDGQRLFYYRGADLSSGELFIDTFSVYKGQLTTASALGPYLPEKGDRDLFVYNDTIILFASNRIGGNGGYDLYVSIKKNGEWTAARNLGSRINSYYDEVSPCLAKNGRRLFFASDRLAGMGGLDLYQAYFDDTTGTWKKPQNLGVPFNSAADDSHLRISAEGLTAFFASGRKSGYGGMDLYAGYMKQTVTEQLMLGVPITFAQVPQRIDPEDAEALAKSDNRGNKEYVVSDLAFSANDVVITPQNIKKLDVLANMLLIHPALKAEFICHDVPREHRSFDLYFSVKKSEQAAEYLVSKGVPWSRLIVKGCGSYYPIAVPDATGTVNPTLARLNRRIEVIIHGSKEAGVSVSYSEPNVPAEYRNPASDTMQHITSGIYYRVKLASVRQMLQHDIFDKVSDAVVVLDKSRDTYVYYAGLQSDLDEILSYRDYIRKNGFGDASIVAFRNGEELSRDALVTLGDQYPDLLRLLDNSN